MKTIPIGLTVMWKRVINYKIEIFLLQNLDNNFNKVFYESNYYEQIFS